MREADLANCSLNLGRNGSAGGLPAGSWKTGKRGRSRPPASLPTWCAGASPAGRGMGRSTRPLGSSRHCGSRSMTSSASSTPRSRHPRAAGAGRTGRDHQLPFTGRPPRQVGVQDQFQADRPDQETRDRDGPGSGRQSPSAKRQTEGGGAMPEPVVIIGPAHGPAGPIGDRTCRPRRYATAAETGIEPERRRASSRCCCTASPTGKRALQRVASAFLAVGKLGVGSSGVIHGIRWPRAPRS